MSAAPVAHRELRSARRALAWVWLSGPASLALMTVGVFGAAYLIATVPGAGPLTAESWHHALEAVAAAGEVGLHDFFGIAAVVATFLVAAAAATAFGAEEQSMAVVTRQALFGCIVVGALLLGFLAVLTVPVAVVTPSETPRVVVVLALTWMALLLTRAVERVADGRERKRRAQIAHERARVYGVSAITSAPRSPWVATVAQFVLPFMIWMGVAAAIFVVGRLLDQPWWQSLVGIACAIYYPNLVLSVVWRATADLSQRPELRIAVQGLGITLAIGSALALALSLASVEFLRPIGWSCALFTVLHAVALFLRTRPRLALLAHIETRVTQRSLAASAAGAAAGAVAP